MIVAAMLFSAALLSAEPNLSTEEFANVFESREYRYEGDEGKQTVCLRYRLFVPRNLKSGERCPLLLWLHGQGEGGMDNVANLKYLSMVLSDTNHLEQYRFFILVPQCPSSDLSWTGRLGRPRRSETDRDDMLQVAWDMLETTMHDDPIDEDRVYMTGICSGGNAAWEMAMRHPGAFAAITPMTPGGGDPSRAALLANTPIWAFQNEFEHPEGVKEMVSAIRQAGGNVHFTMDRSANHDSWTAAIHRYDAVGWMFQQRRGAWVCWTPPGQCPWQWWHVFGVPFGFAAIVGLAWTAERRRRGLSAAAKPQSTKRDA